MRRILSIELYKQNMNEHPLKQVLERNGYNHDHHVLATENSFIIILKSFFMLKLFSTYSFIITNEYYASFAINLRLMLTFSRTKHITVGLNESKKLLKTNISCIDYLINKVFHRGDLFIVHSRHERFLFRKLHDIPKNKFYFSLWGYDLPKTSPTYFSKWPKPYICLIGRNNRDIDTFIKAMAELKIDGVIITSKQAAPDEKLPPNVHVFIDLPLNETLDCIKNALSSAVLIKDDERGAGHITAVAAMFSAKPQIFTDAEVLKDYLISGVNAIGVPFGDPQAVQSAARQLMNDPTYAAWLGENALAYAEKWLSNNSVQERLLYALNTLERGEMIVFADEEWMAAYGAIKNLADIRS